MIALSIALALVSLVLIVAVTGLGWVMYVLIQRNLAEHLAKLTAAQGTATVLYEQLRATEEELRPVLLSARSAPRPNPTQPHPWQVEPPPEPGGTAIPGVAPVPRWIIEAAEARRRDEEILAQSTSAAVAAPAPWDVERYDSDGLEQILTPAPGSKLAQEPPG